MANITAKTSSNTFYKARCEAAAHNEQLCSREGAADIISVERGRLYRIESGIANPYPEEVHMMADLYHAPELRNYYCTEMCPLGCEMQKVSLEGFDRISIRVFSALKKLKGTGELLLEIAEDGIVSEDEKPDMYKILKNLEELQAVTQNMKVWVKKNLTR